MSEDVTSIPHNLDLYRLEGFTGMKSQLITLSGWLTGADDLPAIALRGEQGAGKSTLATAAAWRHLRDFPDGVLRVSAAGNAPFRLYDVVRGMDSVFGTTISRMTDDRWGIAILEQLYRRRRLLILDKLAGATESEISTLADIIGHLHESGGASRIMLIDRRFQPSVAALVRSQNILVGGIALEDTATFIERRAPDAIRAQALTRADTLHRLTGGSPLCLRLVLGLMQDYVWEELEAILEDFCASGTQPERSGDTIGVADVHRVAALAIETVAVAQPLVGPLLERLATARGGASYQALRELFWGDLGEIDAIRTTLRTLVERGIVERDNMRLRVVTHPVIRRYLEESAAMLGEAWNRRSAHYYLHVAEGYLQLPLERWSEVDIEWGNIFRGADWALRRIEQLYGRFAGEMLIDPAIDNTTLPLPPDVESAGAVAMEEARSDMRLMRAYALALAHYAFWRHPPGIQAWLNAGAVAALALADQRNYGWFLMNLGRQHFFMGKIQEAITWFERARAIFDPRDLLMELAYVHTDLGTSLRLLEKVRPALDNFHAAFDCVAQLGDQAELATAYMNLGSAWYGVGSHDRALVEYRKALRVAVRRNDHGLIGSTLNNIGLALEAMERLDDAIGAYRNALYEFERMGDKTGISTAYNNLGSAYYAKQAFAEAVSWYEKDLALLRERGAWTDMAATLHNLGHVALEMRDESAARAYFVQSRDLYAAFDLVEYVAEEQEMIDYLDGG